MKTPILLAASILLATLAQAQAPSGVRITATGEPIHATLDLDTGVVKIIDGPAAEKASVLCFDNSIDDNDSFADALLYYSGDELFDWGVKAAGGSTLIDKIVIGYTSQAPTVIGGKCIVRIYEQSWGFGVPGQEVASLNLNGLPSFPGPVVWPYYLTIDLGSQAFRLPDGPIGWSYENRDGMTAPLLVDVHPSTGTQNYWDIYRPGPASAGNYFGTFSLPAGGASMDPLENSFYLQLYQNDAEGSATPIPGAGNPDNLSAPAPVIGTPWPLVVDLTNYPAVLLTSAILTVQRLPGIPTSNGVVLVDLNTAISSILPSSTGLHIVHVPLDASYIGYQFYAQAAIFTPGTGFQLTNALELFIGAH